MAPPPPPMNMVRRSCPGLHLGEPRAQPGRCNGGGPLPHARPLRRAGGEAGTPHARILPRLTCLPRPSPSSCPPAGSLQGICRDGGRRCSNGQELNPPRRGSLLFFFLCMRARRPRGSVPIQVFGITRERGCRSFDFQRVASLRAAGQCAQRSHNSWAQCSVGVLPFPVILSMRPMASSNLEASSDPARHFPMTISPFQRVCSYLTSSSNLPAPTRRRSWHGWSSLRSAPCFSVDAVACFRVCAWI